MSAKFPRGGGSRTFFSSKSMSLVNAKEEELMNGESSKEDNTKNNKVET